ncbi:MAG: 23S rRNA (adenine(2503)-C(2))-methyltransferase RlmN [Magnetococcales bacterium]|nr:23S rRNA (adenine(2503)-C(2))-methyltransferase RlmN [Magnetococcales bacterium]NGZ04918.1 23S rRNA (adenine(2503)-C(2))-methyltransferase RlmN [Magnetococcales bacterium]
MPTPMSRLRLTGLTRAELTDLMIQWGEKPYRAQQLWSWVFVKLADSVEAMTDLSKPFRVRLAEEIAPLRPRAISHRVSADGTEKWLLACDDETVMETVFIPETNRGTVCVSSQVGCSLACPFCRTGTLPLKRNLTAAEIVEQVTFVRATMAERGVRVTNVVLMGMGEPLYNLEAVTRAVQIIKDGNGLAIGCRKLTISTSGVVSRMAEAGRNLDINLAISLHSVRDAVRDQLVPINKKFNLAALRQAALAWPLRGRGRVTWEYVLLDGINDAPEDARELVLWLRGIPSKVNLLGFNPWPGAPYSPSSRDTILRFQEIVANAGIVTIIRDSRGADVGAACGQLAGDADSDDRKYS